MGPQATMAATSTAIIGTTAGTIMGAEIVVIIMAVIVTSVAAPSGVITTACASAAKFEVIGRRNGALLLLGLRPSRGLGCDRIKACEKVGTEIVGGYLHHVGQCSAHEPLGIAQRFISAPYASAQ